MFNNLKQNFIESFLTIFPVVLVVLLMSLFIPFDSIFLGSFVIHSIILVLGSALFSFGADLSISVIGTKIGKDLIKSNKVLIILAASFIIGIVITVAEPDLLVLAEQVTSIPKELLIFVVSIGVGLCMLLAAIRALFGWDLNKILMISYIIIFLLAIYTPPNFLPIAFDSGGVTTGTLSIPFIMTLGIGLVSNRIDNKAKEDSFGLVALASTGPILLVMILGILYKPADINVDLSIYKSFEGTNYILQIISNFKEVLIAILPLFVVFILYRIISKNIMKEEIRKIIFGFILAIIGLTLFLYAANAGFINMGYYVGKYITSTSFKFLLIPIIMVISFFTAIAEPAVVILIDQVTEFTEGSISKRLLKVALALGVSFAAGLSIFRIFFNVNFIYLAIVGYGVTLLLMLITPKIFTAIAFDAGGATGGALTTAFLLPIAVGASDVLGLDVFTSAFGLASLVSLVPIVTVQIVGIIYDIKSSRIVDFKNLDDSIVEYDWR